MWATSPVPCTAPVISALASDASGQRDLGDLHVPAKVAAEFHRLERAHVRAVPRSAAMGSPVASSRTWW